MKGEGRGQPEGTGEFFKRRAVFLPAVMPYLFHGPSAEVAFTELYGRNTFCHFADLRRVTDIQQPYGVEAFREVFHGEVKQPAAAKDGNR